MSKELKVGLQCKQACLIANEILRIIKRNIKYKSHRILLVHIESHSGILGNDIAHYESK